MKLIKRMKRGADKELLVASWNFASSHWARSVKTGLARVAINFTEEGTGETLYRVEMTCAEAIAFRDYVDHLIGGWSEEKDA